MKYLSEKEYTIQMRKQKNINDGIQRYNELQEEKNKYKKHFKLPTTSKLIAVYLFTILNVVLIYSMIAMWHFMDLTYLGVLVTDVAGQVLTYFIYAKKATIENTKNGIVYDMAVKEFEVENNITNEIVNDEDAIG